MKGIGKKPSVLLIDDNRTFVEAVKFELQGDGLEICAITSVDESYSQIPPGPFDAVLLDHRMKSVDGIRILKRLKENHPQMPVVMITAYCPRVHETVEALRMGAFDFIDKGEGMAPIRSVLSLAIEESAALRACFNGEVIGTPELFRFHGILAKSPQMLRLFKQIPTIARTDSPVLIRGETGTGKELFADAIHEESGRGSYEKINCAEPPDSLLESEIFGHEEGAFTDASKRVQGYFRRARGGTLLLDEIGEMRPQLQAKLLRAIEQGQIKPLGSDRPEKVDCRFLASTHRDPAQTLRKDLYYRLSGFELHIPALRDRPEDIPLLARYFASKVSRKYGLGHIRLTSEAIAELLGRAWEGNVRELAMCIERAVILSRDGSIRRESIAKKPDGEPLEHVRRVGPIHVVERELIRKTLNICNGQMSLAARVLGVSRATLYRKQSLLGLNLVEMAPNAVQGSDSQGRPSV